MKKLPEPTDRAREFSALFNRDVLPRAKDFARAVSARLVHAAKLDSNPALTVSAALINARYDAGDLRNNDDDNPGSIEFANLAMLARKVADTGSSPEQVAEVLARHRDSMPGDDRDFVDRWIETLRSCGNDWRQMPSLR